MTKFPWQQARYQDDISLWNVYTRRGAFIGEIRGLSEGEARCQASQYYEISVHKLNVVLKSQDTKKGET